MDGFPGTDNIPDIDVDKWMTHLNDDIGDFLAAAEGEEVRGGFTDMANVIANVIAKQAVYTDADLTDTSTNAAAQAAAVKLELDKRYRAITGIDSGYPDGYSLIDMPINSVIVCQGDTLNKVAANNITDLTPDAYYRVEKTGRYPYSMIEVVSMLNGKRRQATLHQNATSVTWNAWLDKTVSLSGFPADAAAVNDALNSRYRVISGINLDNYPNGYSLMSMPTNSVLVTQGGDVLSAFTNNNLTGLSSTQYVYVEKTGRASFVKIELRVLGTNAVFVGNIVNGEVVWLACDVVNAKYELGNYTPQSGQYALSTNRARAMEPIECGDALIITPNEGVKYTYRVLDKNLQFLRSVGWESAQTIITEEDVGYILLTVSYGDDSDIADATGFNNLISIKRYGKTNAHLSLEIKTKTVPMMLSDNSPKSPALVYVKYKRSSNKQPVPIGYLYRDVEEPYNFYYDNGAGLQKIFTWDKSVTFDGEQTPIAYSSAITDAGDVLFVYRGERAQMMGLTTFRQNPIIYMNDDYDNPVVIDFGTETKPTSWLQNGGIFCENNRLFIAEYTRPVADGASVSFGKCNVWRVIAPYNNSNNWEIVKSFTIGNDNLHFKHCHTVDRDPWTGILYVSTGDHGDGANMLYSTDDGNTWVTLISGNEKFCRQLNFIWFADSVFWGTDTNDTTKHFLFRATRDQNGIIDTNSITELYQWYTEAATYDVCYSEALNGLLCLDRYDSRKTSPVNLLFYDLSDQKMRFLGRLDVGGNVFGGFRGEAVSTYESPYDNGFRFGFSMYPNQFDIPGNTRNDSDSDNNGFVSTDAGNVGHINNITISIRRD